MCLLGLCSAVLARADALVSVKIYGCSPNSVSIGVGQTVWFVAADDNGPYCIQSTIGAWTPWYLWDEGDGFGITFREQGDFYYREAFTYNTGVIHVGPAVNVPPVTGILSPVDGSSFTAPASFTFSASAEDSDNGIQAVEFYLGTELLSRVDAPPFTTEVTGLAAGNYTLTVVAYDIASASSSTSVNIVVEPSTPSTITLSSPAMVDGQLRFTVSGLTPGRQAVLESATAVGTTMQWIPVETNDISSTTMSFSRAVLPAGMSVFRVVERP